jgi:hypothetical protein
LEPEGRKRLRTLDGLTQFNNREWPVISAKQISAALQKMQTDYSYYQKMSEYASSYVESKFNYKTVADMFCTLISA